LPVVEAFEACVTNYQAAAEAIEPLITEIGEFPGKVTEAADGAKGDIDAMEDFMTKAKAGAAVINATKDCKKCCEILIGDLTNCKNDLLALKTCATETKKLM